MGLFRNLSRSSDLVSGMAERRGVDIAERIMSNPERGAVEFQRLALRCASCDHPEECAGLQASSDHLAAAPDYCRNKAFFDGC